MRFRTLTLDQLTIDDERSFRHVALYDDLKRALIRDGYRFRVPEPGTRLAWDRALLLNLTFWDGHGDALVEDRIAADVVTHVGWHHLASRALAPSTEATALGEAIASAFDLYLVGRLLGHSPDAQFLETQVPRLADVAESAGLAEADFEALLSSIAADPERAFEDLRALLYDATMTLLVATDMDDAARRLGALDGHRFAPLLHHYELSTWVLAGRAARQAPRASAAGSALADAADVDRKLRAQPVSLEWLAKAWLS